MIRQAAVGKEDAGRAGEGKWGTETVGEGLRGRGRF